MTATAATPATYTHVGQLAAVGYQARGRDFNHYPAAAGRRHALNRTGLRDYTALCGVAVPGDSSDARDQGGSNPICKASQGVVSCKACLRRKPVVAAPKVTTVFVVRYATADGAAHRWSSHPVEFLAAEVVERWTAAIASGREDRLGAVRVWAERETVTETW